ncbi:MAG: Excinuclease subunit domain protein [Herbinix sp.]|jgi:excinuclease ABC subunit C|nr:Excinuclease subunit domain protein [Herbinix sp.]
MNTKEDLKDKIRNIPELPGIYRMLDSNGSIIYIGKSKCLKKRVQTYFVNSPKWEKVTRMVTMIKDIEYTVTDTHLEARLLECKLIKFHQPIFNAQLKNDKRYIYLKIDTYNPHHTMSIVSQRTENCYGPFRGHYAMKDFLDNLKSIYPLSKCNENFVIEYHLFPQTLERAGFEVNRNILLDLFSDYNNIANLIAALQVKLIEAADQYRYELASLYRDLIKGFKVIQNGLNRHHTLSTRNILLKLPTTKGVKLFYISKSQIINSHEITRISSKTIDKFIKDSLMRLDTFETGQLNEKASIDFRDILYSEIMSLPEDMVELL